MNWRDPEKRIAVAQAATYRPLLTAAIVALSLLTALLEGIGVGFVLPIIEFAQSSPAANADGVLGLFVRVYALTGVPFTLQSLLGGVAAVMALRFATSFVVSWLRAVLTTGYQRQLRQRLFEALADGPIEYVDQAGSDELLNSLLTETNQAGNVVSGLVDLVESTLQALIYLTIATVVSPVLTLVAVVGLGVSTLLVRFVLEPAYAVGDDIADVNEQLQSISQCGLQGMRDVQLFNLRDELVDRMDDTLGRFFDAGVRLKRNQAALNSLNQFTNALVMFGLIYVGIAITDLSLGKMGVFLFAVFRLSPTLTQLNNLLYSLDGMLPHLVRVQSRIHELEAGTSDRTVDGRPVAEVDSIAFEDVTFAYDDEQVLEDVSLTVERGEHVALVGQSGAGKSTIVSLLGRLQEPDSGHIYADGTPITQFDVDAWRERVAVVRQDPYIFDATLRRNLTVGNRDASQQAIERACETARVTEFLDELPEGYETDLGEDGVRLSGGQQQRVAVARALLKEADVLVFDEATSELDAAIEREVHDGIEQMADEYAMISIAHRLSSVSDTDRIYTLTNGRVAAVGTHEELLDNGGTYANLYETQV